MAPDSFQPNQENSMYKVVFESTTGIIGFKGSYDKNTVIINKLEIIENDNNYNQCPTIEH